MIGEPQQLDLAPWIKRFPGEPGTATIVFPHAGGAAAAYRNFARAEAAQGAVLEDLAGKGVETRSLSPSLLSILAEAATAVLEEEASADPEFARVLAHQRAFREKYARWQALAYPGPSGGAVDGD